VAGQDANASMLTLDSVGIATPPAVDVPHSEKELSTIDPVVERSNESEDRPTAERFYTAAPGAGLFSSVVEPEEIEGAQKVDRPPVERFQTAQEDLNLLAMGNGKA